LDVIQRLILSAWSAKLASETRRAQHDIGEAVRIAESDFLVDVFVRSGPQVVGLVAQLVDEGSGLKAAVLRRSREARSPARGQEFPEPLTGRELELLTYLPSRMSNADLATLCFVSVNTIKTHIARIYRKLGVTNRNEAVERARELGLI
jgi:LuxR family maltose regulon positive regulatory protein